MAAVPLSTGGTGSSLPRVIAVSVVNGCSSNRAPAALRR